MSTRRKTFSITMVDTGTGYPSTTGDWSEPVDVGALGGSGRISELVLRADAGSTVTLVDVLVWVSNDVVDSSGAIKAAFDPDAVPEEKHVVRISDAVIAGSDTAADIKLNLLLLLGGAPFDTKAVYRSNDATTAPRMWLSVKSKTATAATDATVMLSAVDSTSE